MYMLPSKCLKILHVSDLHMDTTKDKGWRMLCHDLVDREKPDLCVISGDLPRHSPSKKLYVALRTQLDALFPDRADPEAAGCKWRWIAVPGNHDRRFFGNFLLSKRRFEKGLRTNEHPDWDWKKPWWDPEYPCIVVPLDSNPRGWSFLDFGTALARGVLGDECDRLERELGAVEESVRKHFFGMLAAMSPRDARGTG